MTKGFIKGLTWGGVVSIVSVGVMSVLSDGPMAPAVVTQGPQSSQAPQSTQAAADRSVGDRVPVTGQKAPSADAPAPDTLTGLAGAATAPASVPEVGAASSMVPASAPTGPSVTGALPAVRPSEPVLTDGTTRVLKSPTSDPAVTLAAEPLEVPPPGPVTNAAESVDASPSPSPSMEAEAETPQTATAPAPVAPEVTASVSEPSISTDPAQPPQPVVPVETQAFEAMEPEQEDPVAVSDVEGPDTTATDSAAAERADTPVLAQVEAPSAPLQSAEVSRAENALPRTAGQESPVKVAAGAEPPKMPTTVFEAESIPDAAQTPSAPADRRPASPASDIPASETETVSQNTQPSRLVTDTAEVPGRPAGTFGDLAAEVRTNRLPTLLDPEEEAAAAEDLPEVSEILGNADARPVVRFAAPADNPDGKPMMAVILMDEGADLSGAQIGLPALRSFPYPVSFAVDASLPDADARMEAYRSEGFEVWAMIDLPDAASARDAEAALEVAFAALPEAVGLLEGAGNGVQVTREAADQVTAILAQTGHGFVTQNRGLNTVQKLAERSGVPAAAVFRDFDSAGQSPTVIRRFLDQAAFRAGQEGGVVMLGRLREDTISALLLWALQSRASQVAMVPASGLLKGQE